MKGQIQIAAALIAALLLAGCSGSTPATPQETAEKVLRAQLSGDEKTVRDLAFDETSARKILADKAPDKFKGCDLVFDRIDPISGESNRCMVRFTAKLKNGEEAPVKCRLVLTDQGEWKAYL